MIAPLIETIIELLPLLYTVMKLLLLLLSYSLHFFIPLTYLYSVYTWQKWEWEVTEERMRRTRESNKLWEEVERLIKTGLFYDRETTKL